jgi:hypothetical protein
VFHDGNDEDGGIAVVKADPLDRIGVPGVLVEGKEPLAQVFDVVRIDGFKDGDRDKVSEELCKEMMVAEDKFEAVVFRMTDNHR